MNDKDDGLALTLSLKCPENHPPPPVAAVSNATTRFPLNLLSSPPLSFLHRHHVSNLQKLPFIINHDVDLNLETGSYASGIDGNRPPWTSALVAEGDDEALLSSPNSTVSSVSGKRAEVDGDCDGDGDDDDEGGEARKKLRLSKDQAVVLEETFKQHHTLNPKQKLALARQLDLRPRQVEVWFQNRRARTKLKQTEVDCEYLKRCCDTLTEENKRLQKEVKELRALKLSPQFYMNMNPPTTLTMCPQCERVAVSTSSTSSGLFKGLHSSMTANQQKENNRFLPKASMIPHRPIDTHDPRW